MKFLPVLLAMLGALIALAPLGLTIARNMLHGSGQDGEVAVLGVLTMFAMPVGLMLMIGGFVTHRALAREAVVRNKRRAAQLRRRRG